MGKGGAGKTTISALTALSLANQDKKVVLISLDPAHNLYEAFKISTAKSSTVINGNLYLEEIDLDNWIRNYLESIEQQVSRSYRYLTSLGLEKHLEILKYSPGMEEYALIYAYQSLLKKYRTFDYLIFDMPPTALALRFFNLPGLTLVWLEKLIHIRRQILEKKNIIETVKTGKERSTHDQILDQLFRLRNDYESLSNRFNLKHQSSVFVILNDDQLSLAESLDIKDRLLTQNIIVKRFIFNKIQGRRDELSEKSSGISPLSVLPLSPEQLLGVELLNKYCRIPEFIRYLSELDE